MNGIVDIQRPSIVRIGRFGGSRIYNLYNDIAQCLKRAEMLFSSRQFIYEVS